MKYKYYISDSTDPYLNLAVERQLFEYADENTAVLYLWQNDNTIVIGKNQDAYAECRIGEFLAQGGRVARRMSGGGAVYHDLGNLNFSMISKSGITGSGITESGISGSVRSGAAAADQAEHFSVVFDAVKLLGIEAEFSGRNDIVSGGMKFSGTAVYDSGEKVCRHGTVLVSTDLEKMTCFLTPGREKLKRHGVDSVRSRVINLSGIVPEITVEKVRDSLIEAAHAAPLECELPAERVREYAGLFGSEKWIYGGRK